MKVKEVPVPMCCLWLLFLAPIMAFSEPELDEATTREDNRHRQNIYNSFPHHIYLIKPQNYSFFSLCYFELMLQIPARDIELTVV